MANVKYWPLAKDWFSQGGNDEVEQPPINLSDKNAYYYRFKYTVEFARFEHATEYKNNLKKLLANNPEHICSICDLDEIEKLDKVENLKLCQPLESSEADPDDDEFKEGGNIKLWGAFVFRKRVKYQIGDAIFVRKTGSDKQEAEQMEYEGKPLFTYSTLYLACMIPIYTVCVKYLYFFVPI